MRFLLVAGDGGLHRRRGEEEGEKPSLIHSVSCFLLAAAREPTRRQWRWCVEETRVHCSYSSRSLPDTVMLVQKAIPVISDCFGANFCNFKIG